MMPKRQQEHIGANLPEPCCICGEQDKGERWTIYFIHWKGEYVERFVHTGSCEKALVAKARKARAA